MEKLAYFYNIGVKMNESKKRDSRQWRKWQASGAVKNINDTLKNACEKEYKEILQTLGNLTNEEIGRLTRFEFYEGPSTIKEQVERYYLKLKAEKPERAAHMLTETNKIVERGISGEKDIWRLCDILHKYWSGFIIVYKGEIYHLPSN